MPEFAEVADGLSMPLADAMRTQRAVRRLRADPVDDETLLAVLELATKAPTGSNAAGLGVRRRPGPRREARRSPGSTARPSRSTAGSPRTGPGATSRPARMLAAVQYQADHFEDAPVIVVACLHGRSGPTAMARAAYYGSIFPAVQNLLLAARVHRSRRHPHHPAPLVPHPGPPDPRSSRPGSPRARSSRSAGRSGAGTVRTPAGRSVRSCTSTTTETGRSCAPKAIRDPFRTPRDQVFGTPAPDAR